MELTYYEFYFNNGICKPLLEINLNNKIINFENTEYIHKLDEDSFLIDITFGFFDNLSKVGISYIDKIFNKLKKKYLNTEKWEIFLKNEHKKRLELNHVSTFNVPKKEPTGIIDFIGKDIDYPKYKLEFDNNLYDLYCFRTINKNNICEKVLIYEYDSNSEIELINNFLNLIFYNSNFTLGVRKCTMCEKYFIIKPSNTFKCNRIFKKGLSCSKYSDTIRRQFAKDEPIQQLISKIKNKYNKDTDKLFDFSEELIKKKEEFYKNKKAFVNWLLTYYSENQRKRIIMELGLSKYL